jgi:mono/diheme cytochrome c family protein
MIHTKNITLAILVAFSASMAERPTLQVINVPENRLPELDQKRGINKPGYDVLSLIETSAEKIKKGKTAYAAKCAACHGAQGRGDGVALVPPPRNFHSLSGWTYSPKMSDVFTVITDGSPGTAMGAFGTLPVEERINLAHFVRSLNPRYPAVSGNDADAIDAKYSLSQGQKDPNIISIKTASAKISEENTESNKAVETVFAKIKAAGGLTASVLVNQRAVTVLSRSQVWKFSVVNLVNLISTDASNQGFSALSKDLSAAQWGELHSSLLDLF